MLKKAARGAHPREARVPSPDVIGPLKNGSAKTRASTNICLNPRACLGPVAVAPASRRTWQEKRKRLKSSAGHSPSSLRIQTKFTYNTPESGEQGKIVSSYR